MTAEPDWDHVAEAVAAAAYRAKDHATGDLDAGGPSGAVAAAVIDLGIRAVEQRRRGSHRAQPGTEPDVPLDGKVLDRGTLADLAEFLRSVRKGVLTRQEIVQEARMWQPLLVAAWPTHARDALAIGYAVDLLAMLPDSEWEPAPLRHVEPANELERAMVAVHQDSSARPALWQALHDGELVLPVVDYELIRPEGARFQFLAAPLGRRPLVYGFSSVERFDTILEATGRISRVTPRGRDLPALWPKGHGLMINPGYEDHVVVSPAEIARLPNGPRR